MESAADLKHTQIPWLDVLKDQIASLRYGVVQIVVHDRRVVQIERTEKFRFEKAGNDRASLD